MYAFKTPYHMGVVYGQVRRSLYASGRTTDREAEGGHGTVATALGCRGVRLTPHESDDGQAVSRRQHVVPHDAGPRRSALDDLSAGAIRRSTGQERRKGDADYLLEVRGGANGTWRRRQARQGCGRKCGQGKGATGAPAQFHQLRVQCGPD